MSQSAQASRISRVRLHDGQAGITERDYDADAWYVVSDRAPYVDVEVVGRPLTPATHEDPPGKLARIDDADIRSGRPYWQRWDLGEYISRKRRMGGCELKLKVPKDHSLRCYIVPSKLLMIADVWSMIEAVEAEVGRPVAWELDTDLGIRSWVREVHREHTTMTDLLLDTVSDEIVAARALRRDPPTEFDRAGTIQPIPELALIPMWAMRRRFELDRAADQIERDFMEYERRLREYMPENRRVPMTKSMATARSQLERLRSVERSVVHHIERDELGRPLVFGPATQRDHRLRKLLRAFTPPTSEVVSEAISGWSRLPPVTLNRLFESWAAIWIVDRIRRLGFSGAADLTLGTNLLEGARWTLKRGDLRVTLDYETHPAQLDFEQMPTVDHRTESAVEWAIKRQFRDIDRPVFGSEKECSPDYILRIEGPMGRVLAVGDACLADPAHHTGEKIDSVLDYRRSIHWWDGGRVIGCHSLGGFAVYPGPPETWNDLNSARKTDDVWLFCPEPRQPESLAADIFERFFQRLICEVTRQ
jgi:hypothetical protein